MTKYLFGVLLLIAPFVTTVAQSVPNCSLTEFRWLCRIPVHARATPQAPSVIDCDGTNVFVTRAQYEEIMRYQRANVNMTLKINGEYIRSPCVPAEF